MLNIAVVGDPEFNILKVFDRTLDSLRQQYGDLTLHVTDEQGLLFQLVRSYVNKRPGCKFVITPVTGGGRYANLDTVGDMIRDTGHVVYFISRHDETLAELINVAESDGVKTLGILWEQL